MTCRLTLAFALTVTPTAAAAQLSDVGIGVALSHHQWLDVPSLCCPPLAWATFGEGRWRLQVDYLRSYGEGDGHGNHPLDPVDGRRTSVQRADLRIDTQHHASVLASWRALEGPRYGLSVLFGAVFVHVRQADCFASAGPVVRIPTPADWPADYVVFRQELTPEERSPCDDHMRTWKRFGPQVGAALDVPIGERFFLRAGARMWLQAEVGVGVKF